jgi:hypothetical protein
VPADPAPWCRYRVIGLAVRQVDVRAGREEGLWAPSGCWEMEGLFMCLCRGVADWVTDVTVEVLSMGLCDVEV